MRESSLPTWVFPPPKGFVAEDLDRIPQLPPHTELIDGNLVFVRCQTSFHTRAVDLLETGVRRTVPEDLRVRRDMSVVLGVRQRPEPDLSVIHASAERGFDQTSYRGQDVVLVAEVVSAESMIRDRERKPVMYAEAGIGHFWLVENQSGKPAVYVYELDRVARSYALIGIHRDRLKVSAPFEIDIDLTEIDRL